MQITYIFLDKDIEKAIIRSGVVITKSKMSPVSPAAGSTYIFQRQEGLSLKRLHNGALTFIEIWGRTMFGFGKRKKTKKYMQQYNDLRLLYFNKPVDENIAAALDCEKRTFELYWNNTLYIMAWDRLSVSYYRDIYTTFLAQGREIFSDHWQVMQNLLLREKDKREQKGEIKNRDGIKITYQTKENGTLICLLTSEVFLSMVHLHQDLLACTDGKDFETVEL